MNPGEIAVDEASQIGRQTINREWFEAQGRLIRTSRPSSLMTASEIREGSANRLVDWDGIQDPPHMRFRIPPSLRGLNFDYWYHLYDTTGADVVRICIRDLEIRMSTLNPYHMFGELMEENHYRAILYRLLFYENIPLHTLDCADDAVRHWAQTFDRTASISHDGTYVLITIGREV